MLMLQALLVVAQEKAKRVLLILWDQASWHKSRAVKQWVWQHNQQVKLTRQGVRLLTVLLPIKSPWLNPMEPIWQHTKQKVCEPDGDLSVKVLRERLCAQFETTIEKATLQLSG